MRLCLIFLLLLPLTAHAASYRDELGRQVVLSAVPQRIVSLAPAVTETLFALGVGERVVGVTAFGNYPPAARSKPRVGDYGAPSLEAVVALAPDLVILSADAGSPAQAARMEAAGLTVFVIDPRDIAATLAMFRQLGQLVGAPARGEALASRLERTLTAARRVAAQHPPVDVLPCIMLDPLTLAGPRTLMSELVTLAGGVNLVPTAGPRYPVWSTEALLAANPERILVAEMSAGPEPHAFFDRWPGLRAVRNGRVATVPADWLLRPGPRLHLGVRALVRALHGVELPEAP